MIAQKMASLGDLPGKLWMTLDVVAD